MKTIDEIKKEEVSEPKKNYRWIIHAIYLAILIAILLLWKCCSDKEKKHQEDLISDLVSLTKKDFSLRLRISELENRKAVLIVNEESINGKSGKFVRAIIVPLDDSRDSSLFIEDFIKRVPFEVFVPVECPPVPECPPYPDVNKGLVNLVAEMDSLLNASLTVCLTKQYKTDSSRILVDKDIKIKSFISGPEASVNYTHTYIEYLPNIYREKAENSFWRGVGFGAASVALYATTEALGHPKYWDNRDNSSAEKKSDAIFWLRTGSAAFAAASLFEFSRTIYFHNKEAKFIINPTKIGLTVNFNPK